MNLRPGEKTYIAIFEMSLKTYIKATVPATEWACAEAMGEGVMATLSAIALAKAEAASAQEQRIDIAGLGSSNSTAQTRTRPLLTFRNVVGMRMVGDERARAAGPPNP